MLDLSAIFWLTGIFLIGYYWRCALIAREHAFAAAQRHCNSMQVQLLDQSVALRRLWFRRDGHGRLCVWRAFYFEFTVIGDDRYVGRVVTLGNRISDVQLEPHRVS